MGQGRANVPVRLNRVLPVWMAFDEMEGESTLLEIESGQAG